MPTYLTRTLSSTDAAALIPQDIDRTIHEVLRQVSPLYAIVDKREADGKTHEYIRRTKAPVAHFEGEAAGPNISKSAYQRLSVQLRILRVWGSVTGFAQAVTERFINALDEEIASATTSLADLFEFATLWANSNDPYMYDGLSAVLERDNPENVVHVGGSLTLTHLDDALDRIVKWRGGNRASSVFLMSPAMNSRVSGLQTKINRQVQQITYEGGFIMDTYRGRPILPSGYVGGGETTTSPDLTLASAAGGSLNPSTTYYYRLASVTLNGEQPASAEQSVTTGASDGTVNLSWTPDPNAYLYRVYRGTTSGDLALVDTISAFTYDADGSPTGSVSSYSDDGSKTPNTAVKPLELGQENIFLATVDQSLGMYYVGKRSPLGDPRDEFISFVELARTRSTLDFMIEAFAALVVPNPEFHVVLRGVSTT